MRKIGKRIAAGILSASLLLPGVVRADTVQAAQVQPVRSAKTESASKGNSFVEDALECVQEVLHQTFHEVWEEGALDDILTQDGYQGIMDLIDSITDPKEFKKKMAETGETIGAFAFQIVYGKIQPYLVKAKRMLRSIGIGSEELTEMAELISDQDIRDSVKEVLVIAGLIDPNNMPDQESEGRGTDWSIYCYMAGNDLESNYWALSHDLEEMMKIRLPENVRVIIEAGGAADMNNSYMDPDCTNRCVYDSEGMHVISQTERRNMGDPETLKDFLRWSTETYPASNTMLVFWGHGGGNDGFCYDQNYDDDCITLEELRAAAAEVFADRKGKPVFDIVGFDNCLMATVETAAVCKEFASGLAASEESESGNGWPYHSLLAQISATPSMTPEQVGTLLCESYLHNNMIQGTDENATFSFTDLTKLDGLTDAYERLGKALLKMAGEDSAVKEKVKKAAAMAQTYGAMFGLRGANLIDLGDFARYLKELVPEQAGDILDALEQCVLCTSSGETSAYSRGLSCFYPFLSGEEDQKAYAQIAVSQSFLEYFKAAASET